MVQPLKVYVVPHDPGWAAMFEREAVRIRAALGTCLVALHHIGSTSIPGIHAKPIIDVLAEATDLDAADAHTAAMEALGYEAMGEFGIPGRRYFRKDNEAGLRSHHVHLFRTGFPDAERHLAFRDFLIHHPEFARQYSDLKCALASKFPDDIEGYMAGKDAFIKDMQRRALAWKQSFRPSC